jgi:hypothetical protein
MSDTPDGASRRAVILGEALPVLLLALAMRALAMTVAFDPELVFEKFFVVARQLLADGWMPSAPFAYSPLYVYLMAVLLALGVTPTVICMLQMALGSATCVLLWGLARSLFGRTVALATGVAAGLYGPFLVHDLSFESDSLGLFLFCAFGLVLLQAIRRPTPGLLAAAGLILGLRLLQRPNALILLLLLPLVGVTVLRGRWPLTRSTSRLGMLILGAACAVAPVTWLNWRAAGELILVTDHSGYALYAGNSGRATGIGYDPPGLARQLMQAARGPDDQPLDHMDSAVARQVASLVAGRPLSSREASALWTHEAMRTIRERGVGQIKLQLRKLYYLVHDFEAHDNEAALLIHHRLGWSGRFGMGVVAPLALVGVALALRRQRSPELWFWLALAAVPVATASLFHVASRLRIDLAAILLPFAAVTVHRIAACVHRRQWREALVLLLVSGALAAPLNIHGSYLQSQARYRRILVHTTLGLHQQDPRRAVFELQQATALAVVPAEAAAAYRGLAECYRQLGEVERAVLCERLVEGWLQPAMVERLRSLPDDPGARYALARHHLLRQEYDRAARELAAAVRLEPGDPELAFGLILARFMAGSALPQETLAALDQALAGDLKFSSEAAAAHRLRARCLMALDRCSEAEEAIEHALRLEPDSEAARALRDRLPGDR